MNIDIRRTLTARSQAIPEFMGGPALTPVSLVGFEGLNQLFAYELVMKTPDGLNYIPSKAANFRLDDFIGQELTVCIELDGRGIECIGAGTREITGLITEARFLREDGRQALYQLSLRPWLHLATLTADCKIFQDQTRICRSALAACTTRPTCLHGNCPANTPSAAFAAANSSPAVATPRVGSATTC